MKNNYIALLSVVLLVFALAVNGALHFFHPSYRYYKKNVAEINRRIDDFERRVKSDFVPAVMSVATNRVVASSSTIASPVSVEMVEKVKDMITRRIKATPFYVRASGIFKSGFSYRGRTYQIGDMFLGAKIIYIDTTIAMTDDGYRYIFDQDENSTRQESEVVKL